MSKRFLNIYLLLMLVICSFVACSGESASGKGDPKEEGTEENIKGPNVFIGDQDSYHTYRIPAIIKSSKGSLLTFCEGRKNSGSDTRDIDLILRHSQDGGKTWGKIITVWDDNYNTCGDPSPVVNLQMGCIHLLMTWNLGPDRKSAGDFNVEDETKDTRRFFYTYSDDDGLTWKTPQKKTSQAKEEGYATGPCHAIILMKNQHKGRIVISCDAVKIGGGKYSYIIYSDDEGASWKVGGKVSGGNESSVAELENGRIIISCRNSSGRRILAWSNDGGESFGSSVKDENPKLRFNLGIYSVRPKISNPIASDFKEGVHALLVTAENKGVGGNTLTVKNSKFDDNSWHHIAIVYDRISDEGMQKMKPSIYLDEELIGKPVVNSDQDTYTTPYCIGANLRWMDNSIVPGNMFFGKIDDYVLLRQH